MRVIWRFPIHKALIQGYLSLRCRLLPCEQASISCPIVRILVLVSSLEIQSFLPTYVVTASKRLKWSRNWSTSAKFVAPVKFAFPSHFPSVFAIFRYFRTIRYEATVNIRYRCGVAVIHKACKPQQLTLRIFVGGPLEQHCLGFAGPNFSLK